MCPSSFIATVPQYICALASVMLSLKYLLLLVSIGLLDCQKFRCDYKYIEGINGWLKVHRIPADWHEARLRCHLEGATLASPLNTAMRNAMTSMIRYQNITYAAFTGIHATFSRGDFFSVEGIPLKQIPHVWAVAEPDNYKDKESCTVLLPDSKMADVKCKETFPYMCYKKYDSNIVYNACGTVDPAYTLERTGSCYKFHRVPRTWSRAYMACAAEGGYLAILNSETEAQVIREIFARNPGSSMVGNFWKDVAYVGIHDWMEHGEWLTIEGKTLREAGYDKFSPGEPNNATTGEFCGAVYRTAMFDDLWCENVYAFICEKDVHSLDQCMIEMK